MADGYRLTIGLLLAGFVFVATVLYGAFGLQINLLLHVFGCHPGSLVAFTPHATFNTSYTADKKELTITHAHGSVLEQRPKTEAGLHSITISIRNFDGEQSTYTWSEAGGQYPIAPGDSVTIKSPTVDGKSMSKGDQIKVEAHGQWGDNSPRYCPGDFSTTRLIFAKTIVG